MKSPHGLCVTSDGRLFVADYDAKAVVVLDGTTGKVLASIAVLGSPLGVAVTDSGIIVVAHIEPNGVVLIESA